MVWSETTSGHFNLFLDYTIGANATDLSIGLYQSGCVTPYTSADPIIEVLTKNNTDVDKNVYVNKRLLSVNNAELVTHDKSKGMSKGSLEFCVKAETWVDSISAAFHKQNLKLTFDLSVNSFEVLNNDITNGAVPRPNPDVSSNFIIVQCTCAAKETYDTPSPCAFPDDTYIKGRFDSIASSGVVVFGPNPIIHGDVFTFTSKDAREIKKYITLLRSRFETDADGKNKFSVLEMKTYGITCVQGPPARRLEIPHRQLTSVYANLVIMDILNFVFSKKIFTFDYTAIVTGDINGESATVSHAGSVSYNPPDGVPEISSATVIEDVMGLSVLTVDTSKYTVTVCHCTKTYSCREGVLPPFSQNSMIYLCVQPNATVQDDVEVSNFFMEFKHGTDVKYTPVTIGKKAPKPNTLSIIQKSDLSYRVATRLITALFDGGATKFDVAGNAYLEFKQSRRLHGRSLQDTPAGESFFKMEVQFKKGVAPANDVTQTDGKSGLVLISVGALLVLSTAFVILKKMKK